MCAKTNVQQWKILALDIRIQIIMVKERLGAACGGSKLWAEHCREEARRSRVTHLAPLETGLNPLPWAKSLLPSARPLPQALQPPHLWADVLASAHPHGLAQPFQQHLIAGSPPVGLAHFPTLTAISCPLPWKASFCTAPDYRKPLLLPGLHICRDGTEMCML